MCQEWRGGSQQRRRQDASLLQPQLLLKFFRCTRGRRQAPPAADGAEAAPCGVRSFHRKCAAGRRQRPCGATGARRRHTARMAQQLLRVELGPFAWPHTCGRG